jgi:hypothetical protein
VALQPQSNGPQLDLVDSINDKLASLSLFEKEGCYCGIPMLPPFLGKPMEALVFSHVLQNETARKHVFVILHLILSIKRHLLVNLLVAINAISV